MMIPRVRAALCSARQPFDCRVEVPPGGECGAVSRQERGRRHRSRSRRRWKSLIKFPVRMFHGPTITRRQFGYTVVGHRF